MKINLASSHFDHLFILLYDVFIIGLHYDKRMKRDKTMNRQMESRTSNKLNSTSFVHTRQKILSITNWQLTRTSSLINVQGSHVIFSGLDWQSSGIKKILTRIMIYKLLINVKYKFGLILNFTNILQIQSFITIHRFRCGSYYIHSYYILLIHLIINSKNHVYIFQFGTMLKWTGIDALGNFEYLLKICHYWCVNFISAIICNS